MTRLKNFKTLTALLFFLLLAGAAGHNHIGNVLYQVSTIAALTGGALDGEVSFRELGARGDFGLGTFDALDGEMIELNHQFFRVGADGSVHKVKLSEKTPFAMAVFFDPERSFSAPEGLDYKGLRALLEKNLGSKNIFYAIKIQGTFKNAKVRSVHKQAPPYPGLNEAVKNQAVFEYGDVPGTLVGFYCPQIAQGVNSPGFHFHFLSQDQKKGGHLLELNSGPMKIFIDPITGFFLKLPRDQEFLPQDIESGKQ